MRGGFICRVRFYRGYCSEHARAKAQGHCGRVFKQGRAMKRYHSSAPIIKSIDLTPILESEITPCCYSPCGRLALGKPLLEVRAEPHPLCPAGAGMPPGGWVAMNRLLSVWGSGCLQQQSPHPKGVASQFQRTMTQPHWMFPRSYMEACWSVGAPPPLRVSR